MSDVQAQIQFFAGRPKELSWDSPRAIDQTSGEELETLAKEVITSDREIIDTMKNLLGK